jgi:hypothetical protein
LIKTIGRIKDIQHLGFCCTPGSCGFHPFWAVAGGVNNAQSFSKLDMLLGRGSFPKDPSGLTALANALREHTAMREFTWFDHCHQLVAVQEDTLDFLLRTLPACPNL